MFFVFFVLLTRQKAVWLQRYEKKHPKSAFFYKNVTFFGDKCVFFHIFAVEYGKNRRFT